MQNSTKRFIKVEIRDSRISEIPRFLIRFLQIREAINKIRNRVGPLRRKAPGVESTILQNHSNIVKVQLKCLQWLLD